MKAMNGQYIADILGELNQVTDTSEWESGEEEKNREQLEELFGPQ